MTSPAFELQVLIVSTLKNSAAVMALIDGVYDTVPSTAWDGPRKAYISLGPSDMTTDDADGIVGETHTVQLDVWSRAVGQPDCKKICTAVKKALHKRPLTMSDNALVEINMTLERIMRDPDGLTIHGAMQFEVMIESLDE